MRKKYSSDNVFGASVSPGTNFVNDKKINELHSFLGLKL